MKKGIEKKVENANLEAIREERMKGPSGSYYRAFQAYQRGEINVAQLQRKWQRYMRKAYLGY